MRWIMNKYSAFSVAEAFVTLLIGSLVLGVSAPLISKQIKQNDFSSAQYNVLSSKIQDVIPVGVITMWSGPISSIPRGWALCDGTKGTPDLRNRFVVGVGSDYSVGENGGEKEITLTKENMPAHSHDLEGIPTITGWDVTNGTACQADKNKCGGSLQSVAVGDNPPWDGKHNNFYIKKAGGNEKGVVQSFENRPPYFALAYIMKVKN